MLEPTALATGIVVVLGKYAIDKGAKLLREAGPKAVEAAKQLYQSTLDHFQKINRPEELEKLETQPEDADAQKRVQMRLEDAVRDDAALKERLEAFLTTFQKEAKAHAQAQNTSTTVTVGSGAAAMGDGSVAVGARGVNVGGNVSGGIITGDGNTVTHGAGQPEDLSELGLQGLPSIPRKLRSNMVNFLGADEIKDVIFDLDMNYEGMNDLNHADMVKKIILFCRQQDRVEDLLVACETANKTLNWRE